MSSLEQLTQMVKALQNDVARLEKQLTPIEGARVVPQPAIEIGRVIGVAAAGARDYQVAIQEPDPAALVQKVDTGYELHRVQQLDKDGRLQSFSQDVVVVSFGHFRVMLPVPGRMVAILDAGTGGPWSRLGTWCDIHADELDPPSAPEWAEALPILNANHSDQFYEDTFPYRTGNVYSGMHVFPLPDETIEGVDPDLGFFIVWTPPRGDAATTFTKVVTPDAGDEITLEVDVDGTGNVVDVRLSAAPP